MIDDYALLRFATAVHMSLEPQIIGIIAGSGIYPETFIEAAKKRVPGVKLVVAGFHAETKPELAEQVDAMKWFRVGQLGKLIKFFKKEGVEKAVMMGQIAPKNLFDLSPDLRTLVMLAKVKERNAETLFGAIADELQKDGVEVLLATTYLEHLLPEEGHVCGPKLKNRAIEDAKFGFKIAKETSRMDIGQSVVVRHGTVLAVEAFEGTNECIARGAKLGRNKSCTLAKVSKPNHDLRFDVPVIGSLTIEACAAAGVSVIACEAGKTMLLGREGLASLCESNSVTLVALK